MLVLCDSTMNFYLKLKFFSVVDQNVSLYLFYVYLNLNEMSRKTRKTI